jgi:hypothetical protein
MFLKPQRGGPKEGDIGSDVHLLNGIAGLVRKTLEGSKIMVMNRTKSGEILMEVRSERPVGQTHLGVGGVILAPSSVVLVISLCS